MDHETLSQEMWSWAAQVQEAHRSTWEALYPFYCQLQQLAANYYGYVEIIGSFASQLWIPNCDVDLLMVFPESKTDMLEEITDIVYGQVEAMRQHRSIRLITNYKLPLIKLVLSGPLRGL